MSNHLLTEQDSPHRHLETWNVIDLITAMNLEDQKVAMAVKEALPAIEKVVEALAERMRLGGRLFYIGAGTSGRLGILDASECPPTFGVPSDWVIGFIAGGDQAIRKAVEGAEDDDQQAWNDLLPYSPHPLDTLIGIAASGTTPYVIGGIQKARDFGMLTACITCNPLAPLIEKVEFPIVVATGPEFLTGSTRLKAGTAQKMVLNMITTSTMIQLGRVKDNKMVDMQLTNKKLVQRGIRMIMNLLQISEEESKKLLMEHGSVRAVLSHFPQS